VRSFFDTNILVYSQDKSASTKRALARLLVEEAIGQDAFVVSTQVLVEFYATAMRNKLLDADQALGLVRLWSDHDTVVTTSDLLLRALELHQEHSLSVWDALIVQAAIDARCDVLFTEDFQHGRRFGELTIENPFREGHAAHEPGRKRYIKRSPRDRKMARELKAFTDAQKMQDHTLGDRLKRKGRA
jgi:predicted nucleic acid-binding protein